MTTAPEPATSQPARRGLWIFVIVLAVTAIGLDLFSLVRWPETWPGAAPGLLIPVGLILLAWNSLLPVTSTGAKRTLIGLSLVCTVAGLVLEILHLVQR